MKRMSLALVVAGLLSVAVPGGAVHASSEAATLEPVVQAIKKQFAKKSGVRFTVRQRGSTPPSTEDYHRSGAYRFRASGVYAADTTSISQEWEGTRRTRDVSFGGELYSQDYVRSKDGRYVWKSPSTVGKWAYEGMNLSGVVWGEDLINGINPGFLRLAAAHDATSAPGGRVEGAKTTLYSGTVTVPELGERQAGMFFGTVEGVGEYAGPIRWKLWVGPDNLPRRFFAAITFEPVRGGPSSTMTMNTVYRDWGTKAKITAPPRRLVIMPGD